MTKYVTSFLGLFDLIYNLYLPLTVFIAITLVGSSKQLKQIIAIEHNIVKNPNWSETNQLAIWPRI